MADLFGGRHTNESNEDGYRVITTHVRKIREASIFVDRPHGAGEVSIPRSLIHGADDRKLDGCFIGEEVTFRLIDWKAEELGFA